MIQSPLNYTGGKFKLLPQILPLFPNNIDLFVDLFCGGCNVVYLYNAFKNLDKKSVFDWIDQTIKKYGLSTVSVKGYDYYHCDSSKGLGNYNREKFLKLREDFNEKKRNGNYDYYYYIMLYVIII